ncbi:g2929 [Coccomyxa elongata]
MSYYSCLQSIVGDVDQSFLYLDNVTSLNSLAGLQSLTTIEGGMALYELPGLTTIDNSTFPALRNVGAMLNIYGIYIYDNPALTSISGFQALENIDALEVGECYALTSISGFEALASATSMTITDNTALTAITGFSSLTTIRETAPKSLATHG